MALIHLSAQDVLIEGTLPEYKRAIEFFYRELVFLNTDIFILEKIFRFPFSLFVESDNMIFFQRVVDNFLTTSLLTITKVATDNGSDLYTIRGFRNRIRELVRPEYQEGFREVLRQSRFDQNIKNILAKAHDLRNGRIAHATQALAFHIPEQDRIDFAELVLLKDALNAQLNALSFNTDHLMLPIPYSSRIERPKGITYTTDITGLLDSIAQNSILLRLPEQQPQQWDFYRDTLTDAQITCFNQYRIKFDLSEVK